MDSVIDLPALLERFDGDKDILQEVVKLFIDDCPKLMDEVRIAVARKDPAAVDRTAHTLKGSASNFSASAAAAAMKLERMGRAGSLDGAEQAFAALEQEIARLVPALGVLVAEPEKA
jgi:HPt (histidine-containing phosphotransfer) domain-containing protein